MKATNNSVPVTLPTVKIRMADIGWNSSNNLGQRVRGQRVCARMFVHACDKRACYANSAACPPR